MDWESETTKKHIKEAEAQGCKLLGPGKNSLYRLYGLPCGHERKVSVKRMRTGSFECKTCLAAKFNQEAEAQGCELLGAGKNHNFRLYRLPCGHEQEVVTTSMRVGGFRCRACMTEKLNQEAKAHGCKVKGAGKNAQYRLYELPCGHEQQVTTGEMRKGGFECKTCLNERLNREAEVQGCKLLGTGRNKGNRLYLLPCSHEQVIETGKMRVGAFRCQTCLAEKLNQEAKAQRCKLLGAGKNAQYRLYALPCGHEQGVLVSAMRDGRFRCGVCLAEKLNQEAEAQGCKLLGPGRQNGFRLYELPCGHEQQIQTGNIRDDKFRCQTCQGEKLKEEAQAQGCKLLGAGRTTHFRLYALACGHEQQVTTGNMRLGNFMCSVCMADKLRQEAEAQGCTLLGEGKDANHRLYEMPCGHEREVATGQMRIGYFVCQICEETSRTLPSNVYLFHIKLDSDEWLKLGYAKSVTYRASRYGLPEGAKITTVCSLPFATGNEAHTAEADIHKRYRRKRLSKKLAKEFGMLNGFDECYPVTMLDTLLAELEVLKQSQSS